MIKRLWLNWLFLNFYNEIGINPANNGKLPFTQTEFFLIYSSSTLDLAHGVFLKNFRLDLMPGS
jgi:hypothetical protein